MRKIILSLLASALLFSCNNYEKSKEGFETVSAPYSTSMKNRYRGFDNHKKPGYGVMVLKDGEIEHAAGYGMANIEEKQPILPQTRFHSWLLFAESVRLSLLNLWEEGKVDLDAPITDYIDYLPEEYKEVKVDYIIGKTSGFLGLNENRLKGELRAKDIIEHVSEKPKFKFEPGTYTSFEGGWVEEFFMVAIVEKVTGEDIVDYINNNVFKPLKMENSQVYQESALDKTDMSYYKRRAKKLIPITYDGWVAIGSSTTITNMEDMAKFYKALDYGNLVSEKVYAKYRGISTLSDGTEAIDKDNKHSEYFEGYFTPSGYMAIPKKEGVKAINFGGDDQATSFYPEDNYRIFVVNNLPDGQSMDSIFKKVQPLLFPQD